MLAINRTYSTYLVCDSHHPKYKRDDMSLEQIAIINLATGAYKYGIEIKPETNPLVSIRELFDKK